MSEFTEVKTAAELNPQSPPPFVASQSGAVNAPTANEEAELRAMFQNAAEKGMDLTDTVSVAPKPPEVPAPAAVPEKFQKPDGTVDEDKLKASSKQLDAAIEQKQKTVDELLADYNERQKQLGALGDQQGEIKKQLAQTPTAPAAPVPQDLTAVHAQIMQDFQRDPIGTTVNLAEAIAKKNLEPFVERFRQDEEARRNTEIRDNVTKLSSADPRILDPRLYAMVNQVLQEDPAMMRLKNPHKAAWNEVKERLRLGEPSQVQAQPSIPSPTLGRGAPPSVSTLPGPLTPQSAYQQAVTVTPYSEEGKAYEEKLREMTRGLWQ